MLLRSMWLLRMEEKEKSFVRSCSWAQYLEWLSGVGSRVALRRCTEWISLYKWKYRGLTAASCFYVIVIIHPLDIHIVFKWELLGWNIELLYETTLMRNEAWTFCYFLRFHYIDSCHRMARELHRILQNPKVIDRWECQLRTPLCSHRSGEVAGVSKSLKCSLNGRDESRKLIDGRWLWIETMATVNSQQTSSRAGAAGNWWKY